MNRRLAADAAPALDGGVPAAHSMDSTWFAVDETGEVALFETGEDGAVPEAAGVVGGNGATDEGEGEVGLLGLAAVRLLEEIEDDAALPPSDDPETGWLHLGVWLREKEPRNVRVLHRGRRVYVRLQLAEGEVAPPDALRLYVADELDSLARYRGDEWSADPGSYRRTSGTNRLFADQLPPPLRDAVSKLVLPLRFRDTAELHLADLPVGRCVTWHDAPLRREPSALADVLPITDEVLSYRQPAGGGAEPRDRSPGKRGLGLQVVVGVVLLALVVVVWWWLAGR